MIRKKNGTAVRKPPGNTFTVWGDPNERFLSQYGLLTYRQWCDREAERIGKMGRIVVVREAEDGEIALEEVCEGDGSKNGVQQEGVGQVQTLP